MPLAALLSPVAIAALLVPAWGLAAAVLFIGGAPGEWARTALIVWTVLSAALLAGGEVMGGGMPLALAVLVIGFAAVMTGGPWGLVVAAAAAGGLLVLPTVAGPRWLPLMLALPPAVVALRQLLWR